MTIIADTIPGNFKSRGQHRLASDLRQPGVPKAPHEIPLEPTGSGLILACHVQLNPAPRRILWGWLSHPWASQTKLNTSMADKRRSDGLCCSLTQRIPVSHALSTMTTAELHIQESGSLRRMRKGGPASKATPNKSPSWKRSDETHISAVGGAVEVGRSER